MCIRDSNPGVDPWLPGAGTEVILPTRFILPPGPREGIVINLAEYRLYYYPKGRNVVYTFPLGIGREGWGSPDRAHQHYRENPESDLDAPGVDQGRACRRR